jgi:hypothetical protein
MANQKNMIQVIFKEMFQEAGLAILICVSILVAAKFIKPEEDVKL